MLISKVLGHTFKNLYQRKTFLFDSKTSILITYKCPSYISVCRSMIKAVNTNIYMTSFQNWTLSCPSYVCLPLCPFVYLPFHLYTSVHLSFHQSVHLSVHLYVHCSVHAYMSVCPTPLPSHVHPSVHLSVYPPVFPSVCLHVRPSGYPTVHPSVFLSVHMFPSVCPPLCPYSCLSICLSTHLYVCSIGTLIRYAHFTVVVVFQVFHDSMNIKNNSETCVHLSCYS